MTARLAVRVHPGARRNAIRGWLAGGVLKLEVTAAPEAGRANQAVCALIAKTVGVGRRQVTVVRGETSRSKLIEVAGIEAGELKRRLLSAMEDLDDRGE